MKTNNFSLLSLLVLSVLPATAFAADSTFTYQGRLNVAGHAAEGLYDLSTQLYPAEGSEGNAVSGAITNTAVVVRNGLFSLPLDFGSAVFDGRPRWLQIGVRTNGSTSSFESLAPRQQITPTPYALHATTAVSALAANESVTSQTANVAKIAVSIADGAITDAKFLPTLKLDLARVSADPQTFAGANLFSKGVSIRDLSGGLPLTVSGNNPFPQLKVAAAADAPYGSFLSIDAELLPGGKDYLIFSTAGSAAEGSGRLVFQNHSDGVEVMSLNASGAVGFGTHNPAVPMQVVPHDPNTTEIFVLGNDPHSGGYTALSMGLTKEKGGQAFVQAIAESGMRYGNLLLNANGGNVGIGVENPATALDVAGEITTTAINITSDRNAKREFSSIAPRDVLQKVSALSITEWEYITQPGVRHIGPMAQDFHDAFSVGRDERHITSVDADGVALAAIQGLHELLQEKNQEMKLMKLESQDLLRRLSALEQAGVATPQSSSVPANHSEK